MWRTGEVRVGFWWGNLRERDHLKNVGVDGGEYQKGNLIGWEIMDWINLAQDWDKLRDFVKKVMNIRVP